MVHEASDLDLSGCKRLQQRPKENCVRPPFGEYLVYKRGIHGNLSSQFLWTDSSWKRLRAQSCGDGHEAADPLPRAFFLSKKARLTLGRGGMGGRKGSAIRIKTVVDLGAGTRTFFDLLSQDGCHSMGFHRGAVQARKQSHPLPFQPAPAG